MENVYAIQLQMYLSSLLQTKAIRLTHVLKQSGVHAAEAEVLNAEIKSIREEIKQLHSMASN